MRSSQGFAVRLSERGYIGHGHSGKFRNRGHQCCAWGSISNQGHVTYISWDHHDTPVDVTITGKLHLSEFDNIADGLNFLVVGFGSESNPNPVNDAIFTWRNPTRDIVNTPPFQGVPGNNDSCGCEPCGQGAEMKNSSGGGDAAAQHLDHLTIATSYDNSEYEQPTGCSSCGGGNGAGGDPDPDRPAIPAQLNPGNLFWNSTTGRGQYNNFDYSLKSETTRHFFTTQNSDKSSCLGIAAPRTTKSMNQVELAKATFNTAVRQLSMCRLEWSFCSRRDHRLRNQTSFCTTRSPQRMEI